MIDDYSDQARALLNLLNKLPTEPQITFRGYVDHVVDRVRVVGSPTLTATAHSLEIATSNLARPEIAIIVGVNGRDLASILQEAPNFNLREATYLLSSCFLQHAAHEYNGMMIRVYEEIILNSQLTGSTITHPLHTWDPIPAALGPALRAAWERPLSTPEGSSDRFSEPIH